MGLKCKLQKSVQPTIVDKSDKVLAGFFQSFSVFNSSQLFFLLSFVGLIGVIIWYTQPNDSESSESESSSQSSSSSSSSSSNKKSEDEQSNDDSLSGQTDQFEKTSLSNLKRRNLIQEPPKQQSKYRIDTIYESSNEPPLAPVQEKFSFLKKNVESVSVETSQAASESTTAVVSKSSTQTETHEVKQVEQVRSSKVDEGIDLNSIADEINKTSVLSQQQRTTYSAESSSSVVTSVTSTETSRVSQVAHSQTDYLVDKILDDLVMDEKEAYAYGRHKTEVQKLSKQDSMSNRTESFTKDTDSHNSLLELFNAKHVHAIEDHFQSLDEISQAIKNAGLENSQLIFGIDFTISNLENGTRTFNGRSLHYFDENIKNPYQKVIEILGKTLECFDVDGRIPVFGFGDARTKDRKVFPFSPSGYCNGFKDALSRYNQILKDNIQLSGPTNFAPLIKEAIKIVKETKQYHILVIVADGQVTNERQTRDAIVEASKYALSIIMVGVGDGPWDTMNEFDDSLPKRQFDNFQFVNYHDVIDGSDNPDETFALHALMEIPDQFKSIKELGLLNRK